MNPMQYQRAMADYNDPLKSGNHMTKQGQPIISWQNWKAGDPTQGANVHLGSGDAGRNPALMAQLQANFRGAAPGQGQYDMFNANPAMWNNKFRQDTGINNNWINANAYDPGHQYMNSGDFNLTPGQGSSGGGRMASAFNGTGSAAGSVTPGGAGAAINNLSGGGAGSWNPAWRPDQVAGRTGDQAGTYGGAANQWESMGPGAMNGRYNYDSSGQPSDGMSGGGGFMPQTPTGTNTQWGGTPTVMPSMGPPPSMMQSQPKRPQPAYFTNPTQFRPDSANGRIQQ